MTNTMKGEVTVESGGKTYTLIYSLNALCALESELGDDATQELSNLLTGGGKRRFTTLRTVFWCGLRDHHPELTRDDAGAIATGLGLPKAFAAVADAVVAAFPESNPGPFADPAPAGGTGPNS